MDLLLPFLLQKYEERFIGTPATLGGGTVTPKILVAEFANGLTFLGGIFPFYCSFLLYHSHIMGNFISLFAS